METVLQIVNIPESLYTPFRSENFATYYPSLNDKFLLPPRPSFWKARGQIHPINIMNVLTRKRPEPKSVLSPKYACGKYEISKRIVQNSMYSSTNLTLLNGIVYVTNDRRDGSPVFLNDNR